MEFDDIIATPPSGRGTAVLIDHLDYAQAVILQGRPIPWNDPIAYSQFLGKAQGLLRPDTTLLDLGAFYDHLTAGDDRLRSAMTARSRTGYALKTLLADAALAVAATDLAKVVAQTSSSPLVVQVPSPMLWLARTHAGDVDDLQVEHAENAAMYLADWLRRLAELPVSMLLLDERWTGAARLADVPASAYAPVANLTEHYRWALGRRTWDSIEVVGSAVTGAPVPAGFWLDVDAPVPVGDFLLADIPAHAVPEHVLAQLSRLG